MTHSERLAIALQAAICIFGWLFGHFMGKALERARREEDEEFYRQIYGPGGKPKKDSPTAAPVSR